MSWLAEKNATVTESQAMAHRSRVGSVRPKSGIDASSSNCVASIQPRLRPSIGSAKRSISGDHRNFHVKGSWISANRPIDFKSTCSERSHAGSKFNRR